MSSKEDPYRVGILEVRKTERSSPGKAFGVWILPLNKWVWSGLKKDYAEDVAHYFGQGDGHELLLAAIGGHQETGLQIVEMIHENKVPARPRKVVAPRVPKQTEDWIDIPFEDLPPMRVPVKKRIGDFVVHHTVIPAYTNAPAHIDDELWTVSYKNGYTVSMHATYLKRLRDATQVAEKLAGEWNETFQKAMDGESAAGRQIVDNIKKHLGIKDAIREYNRNPTCCGGAEAPVLRNPAWADRVLNTQRAETRKYATKHGLPSPIARQLTDSKGHQKWLEFGCGTYGCVYPTSDPDIVVKLTRDADEVAIAKHLMKLGDKAPAGIVKYSGVLDTELSQNGAPLFLLWRESASSVGGYADEMNVQLDRLQDFASIAKEALDRWRGDPEQLPNQIKRAGNVLAKLGVQVIDSPTAHTQVLLNGSAVDVRNVPGWFKSNSPKLAPSIDSYAMMGAAGWMAAIEIAKKLAASEDLHLVGEAFLELSKKGILLADVRSANLGLVNRGGQREWVIVDPGYSYSAGKTKLVPDLGPGPKANPVRTRPATEYVKVAPGGGKPYEVHVDRRFGTLVAVKQGHFWYLFHQSGLQLGPRWRNIAYVSSKARFYNKDPKGSALLGQALIASAYCRKDPALDDIAEDWSYNLWAWGERLKKQERRAAAC